MQPTSNSGVAATAPSTATPTTLTDASAVRAASPTDCLAAGTSTLAADIYTSAASTALGDGVGDSTSRGGAPHRSPLPPPPPPSTMNSPGSPGERAPTTHAAGTPRSVALGAPAARSSSPSGARPGPASVAAWRGRPLGPGAWAGQTVRRPRSPSTEE
jgi:hypothetical protein